MKNNFYFTFGQMYAREPHPKYEKANPDGWVRIVADDYEQARTKAFEMFGDHFAMQYSEKNWNARFFKYEIEVITI